ncbi:hypothetical protein J2Y69_000415 [Microbacterium resistens]|uniref:Uncharacterized protein n=1 Tax=Microbacterium resistens TaxID=156977 RepID=A0ABU1S997_9MICO|nr:hypothetical protein [Microbacterium resistens]MDR6865833.1 hypothetical protein [Microbacterium resistens]
MRSTVRSGSAAGDGEVSVGSSRSQAALSRTRHPVHSHTPGGGLVGAEVDVAPPETEYLATTHAVEEVEEFKLVHQVQLLENPYDLYAATTDEVRRRMSQAVFGAIYIIDDDAGSTLTAPHDELFAAQAAYRAAVAEH